MVLGVRDNRRNGKKTYTKMNLIGDSRVSLLVATREIIDVSQPLGLHYDYLRTESLQIKQRSGLNHEETERQNPKLSFPSFHVSIDIDDLFVRSWSSG